MNFKWTGMGIGWGLSVALAVSASAGDLMPVHLAGACAVSPDGGEFAFEWRGDLWIAPSAGGEARPIATHPAQDLQPAFSPDGRELAFVSNRDDTWQIYTVPAGGGVPVQRTWNTGGRTLYEYTPDGRSFLFYAHRDGKGPTSLRLYTSPRDQRGPERMIFDDYGTQGTISPDGKRLLFVREGEEKYRQGYRGSMAAQIWLYHLESKELRPVVSRPTSATNPMWRPDGKGFYYLDFRSGCANLWACDLESGDSRALTAFTDGNIGEAAISRGGTAIIFEQLFDFYRLDPTAPKPEARRIDIVTASDIPTFQSERRWYDKVWNNDRYGTLDWSPDGLEMVFTAGGDVWVMDTVLRDPRPVTTGTLEHDVEAVFSPDQQFIYFLRDTGDGVNVWRASRKRPEQYWWQSGLLGFWKHGSETKNPYWWQNDAFPLEPLTQDRNSRYGLRVSPNGRMLSWIEGRGRVCVFDLRSKKGAIRAEGPKGADAVWSPDNRWLACRLGNSSDNSDIWIVAADGQTPPYNLSRNPNYNGEPVWSPDGKMLAFVGRTYDQAVDLYRVWMSEEDDEISRRDLSVSRALETMDSARKNGKGGSKPGTDPAPPESGNRSGSPIRIDFNGLAERVNRIPVSGAPTRLCWSPDSQTLYYQMDSSGETFRLSMTPEGGKPERVVAGTGLYPRVDSKNRLLWLKNGVPASNDQTFPFTAYTVVDPVEYQRLAFRIIWRQLRDNFYDRRMNGRDWDALRVKYEEQAARAIDAASFDRVTAMLFGELNASHMGYAPEVKQKFNTGNWPIRTAHLGLWFDPEWKGPGWKVSGVIRNGPADTLRNHIAPGEIVKTVDGIPVAPDRDPTEVLNVRFPHEFQLAIETTDGRTRDVSIKGTDYPAIQADIRSDWVRSCRDRVSMLSSNTIGYLNIQAMNYPSLRQFEKDIFAEGVGKDGLVIDIRGNPGGFISDFLLAILCHPAHAITVLRDGEPSYPAGYLGKVIWTKPVVVLINQHCASNAEIFSHAIKAMNRGKLIGVPTQGAVISTPEVKVLDVGVLRLPDRGWFSVVDGEDMERHGVMPDYLVWPTPGDLPAGRDVQLDRATDVLLKEIRDDQARPRPPLIRASERIPAKE